MANCLHFVQMLKFFMNSKIIFKSVYNGLTTIYSVYNIKEKKENNSSIL